MVNELLSSIERCTCSGRDYMQSGYRFQSKIQIFRKKKHHQVKQISTDGLWTREGSGLCVQNIIGQKWKVNWWLVMPPRLPNSLHSTFPFNLYNTLLGPVYHTSHPRHSRLFADDGKSFSGVHTTWPRKKIIYRIRLVDPNVHWTVNKFFICYSNSRSLTSACQQLFHSIYHSRVDTKNTPEVNNIALAFLVSVEWTVFWHQHLA